MARDKLKKKIKEIKDLYSKKREEKIKALFKLWNEKIEEIEKKIKNLRKKETPQIKSVGDSRGGDKKDEEPPVKKQEWKEIPMSDELL